MCLEKDNMHAIFMNKWMNGGINVGVMKHVMTSSNDSSPLRGDTEKLSNDRTYNMVTLEIITPPSTPQVMGSKDKLKFHDQALHIHLQRW